MSELFVAADPVNREKSCQGDRKDVSNNNIAGGDFIVVVNPEEIDKKSRKHRYGGENDGQESGCEWQIYGEGVLC